MGHVDVLRERNDAGLRYEVHHRSTSQEPCAIMSGAYAATLYVRAETVLYLSRLVHGERRRRTPYQANVSEMDGVEPDHRITRDAR
jgi:hypothetical protein